MFGNSLKVSESITNKVGSLKKKLNDLLIDLSVSTDLHNNINELALDMLDNVILNDKLAYINFAIGATEFFAKRFKMIDKNETIVSAGYKFLKYKLNINEDLTAEDIKKFLEENKDKNGILSNEDELLSRSIGLTALNIAIGNELGLDKDEYFGTVTLILKKLGYDITKEELDNGKLSLEHKKLFIKIYKEFKKNNIKNNEIIKILKEYDRYNLLEEDNSKIQDMLLSISNKMIENELIEDDSGVYDEFFNESVSEEEFNKALSK